MFDFSYWYTYGVYYQSLLNKGYSESGILNLFCYPSTQDIEPENL